MGSNPTLSATAQQWQGLGQNHAIFVSHFSEPSFRVCPTEMNVSDYIIAQDGLNLTEMLGEWNWALPKAFEVWIVTRFADLVIVQEDGAVWFLDTSAGTYRHVADSKDHFADLRVTLTPLATGLWFELLMN